MFSSQESLDESDPGVAPMALFRSNSFLTTASNGSNITGNSNSNSTATNSNANDIHIDQDDFFPIASRTGSNSNSDQININNNNRGAGHSTDSDSDFEISTNVNDNVNVNVRDQQQMRRERMRVELSNLNTEDAAMILFPPPTPERFSPKNNNNMNMNSTNMNMTLNDSTASDDTVVTTEAEAETEDDSCDVSPVPSSPGSNWKRPLKDNDDPNCDSQSFDDTEHTHMNMNMNIDVNIDNSRCRMPSLSKRQQNSLPPMPPAPIFSPPLTVRKQKHRPPPTCTINSIHNNSNSNSTDISTINVTTAATRATTNNNNKNNEASKPTLYTSGWSSSFTFSGSPIQEELLQEVEEERDAKMDIHMDTHTNTDSRPMRNSNTSTTIHTWNDPQEQEHQYHHHKDEDYDDDTCHVSSKIRRLNLDNEIDYNISSTSLSSVSVSSSKTSLHIRTNFDSPRRKSNDYHHHPSSINSSSSSSNNNENINNMMAMSVEKERKDDYDRISPNDVTDFPFFPTSATKPYPSQQQQHQLTQQRQPLQPPLFNIHGGNNDVEPPTPKQTQFASPPSIVKKAPTPHSPYRLGNRRARISQLQPTTPKVPQKTPNRRMTRFGLTNSNDNSHNNNNNNNMNNNNTEQSRFMQDFEIISTLGNGSFGTVYKCLSTVDGRYYAVKAAKRRAKGKADRDRMLKEVKALAALSDVADNNIFHIVRYHQAWMEENRLHIVTELCTSTLQEEMTNSRLYSNTKRLYKLLREMLLALRLIHKHGLVHLDIKPENIFVRDDSFKLGDFGLVSKVSVQDDVEEGDSRYMCMDLLSGNHDDLTKCDIFSLGITMYEIVLNRPLPLEGQEWQDLRAGKLSQTLHVQPELQTFIRMMMHPDASQRPTAADLLTRRQLLSEEEKRLIYEQNKVREANMALAFQMKKISPPRRLFRSNTCPR